MNINEHIGEDGNFTEGFKEAALTELGDDYKDSKIFDNISNPDSLVSAFAHTKSAYDKKMENVIAKPKKDASDEDKATYRESLLKELGTPDDAEGYEFVRPESLPEGMEYDENAEASFRQLFHELRIPADMARTLSEKFSEFQIARHMAQAEAEQAEFVEETGKLDTDWSGNKSALNNRIALKAVLQFADEGLKNQIKETKLSENVTDHTIWKSLGFTPYQRRIWHNIGLAVKSDTAIPNEGGPVSGDDNTMEKIYDHPTSRVLHKK